MSCESCMLPPRGVYDQVVKWINLSRVIENSTIRVVYIHSDTINTLEIDGSNPSKKKTDTSYFSIESGEKILSLVDKKGKEVVSDLFIFEPNEYYTIIIFGKYIMQFHEVDLTCPMPHTAKIQAYNLDGKNLDIYFDEELIFENVGEDMFIETLVRPGVYDFRFNTDEDFVQEVEIESGIIYTIFFIFKEGVTFIVENEYCDNPI